MAIFNSLLRYGVAVFLKPIYEKEDLNMEKNPKNTAALQTLQNNAPVQLVNIHYKPAYNSFNRYI